MSFFFGITSLHRNAYDKLETMWFVLALFSGLANAGGNISRRMTGQTAQPMMLAWWSGLLSIPMTLGLVLIDPAPLYRDLGFLLPGGLCALLVSVGHILLFKAYKLSEASVVGPINNLLPVLLVGTSYLMFGILPTLGSMAGILLVVAGMYYSSVNHKKDIFHPLKALLKERGAWAMLTVVLIWAITTNLDQIAIRHASPSFELFYVTLVSFILTSVYVKYKLRHAKRRYHVFRRWKWHIIAITVFSTISVTLQLHAIALAPTAYVLAVKRSDVIFTVLAGGLFLREHHMAKRLTGAAIGAAGIAIIILFK